MLFTSAQQLTAQAKTPSQDSTCPSWNYREDIVPEYFKPGFQTAIFGIQSSRGLPEAQHVLLFDWSQGTCGGLQESIYALWIKTGHFQLLPPLRSMGEAGFYAQTEQYIFPDETEDVKYKYPLMCLSISITKLKFVNNVWRK